MSGRGAQVRLMLHEPPPPVTFFLDGLLTVFMNYFPHTSVVSGVASGGWVGGWLWGGGGIFSLHSGHQ